MKSITQAIIGAIIAVALAFAFRYVFTTAIGTNDTANTLDEYGTLMLEARGLFIELSEDIIDLTLAVHDMDGLVLLRGGDGGVYALSDGEVVPALEALSELDDPAGVLQLAQSVFSETYVETENSDGDILTSGDTHYNVLIVTPEAVVIHSRSHPKGNVGILYMKENAAVTASSLEIIELVEEWQIFYTNPD